MNKLHLGQLHHDDVSNLSTRNPNLETADRAEGFNLPLQMKTVVSRNTNEIASVQSSKAAAFKSPSSSEVIKENRPKQGKPQRHISVLNHLQPARSGNQSE